jgi:uncharacterized glyoxalase superfamily protein PhnB
MISSTAIFACSDIEATLAYYKDVLGFESSWTWGEPPSFGSASVGGVTIMFCLQPELAKVITGHQHWIKVDDADLLWEKHSASGAKIVSHIEDKPWGVREYIVEDLHGYHLRIAGPPSDAPRKSQPFPEGVSIQRRMPTPEEYGDVAARAFGRSDSEREVLAVTWGGIVATSSSGEAVGVLRIMREDPAGSASGMSQCCRIGKGVESARRCSKRRSP